jgi:hypothetical protein
MPGLGKNYLTIVEVGGTAAGKGKNGLPGKLESRFSPPDAKAILRVLHSAFRGLLQDDPLFSRFEISDLFFHAAFFPFEGFECPYQAVVQRTDHVQGVGNPMSNDPVVDQVVVITVGKILELFDAPELPDIVLDVDVSQFI